MRLLMCAPRHYAIRYEINPWMKLGNAVQGTLAERQWKRLYTVLKSLGVKVELIQQHKSSPDMVFTANAGIVDKNKFIPSHFRFPERQRETPLFSHHFRRKGYRIQDVAKGLFFEGEGDLLLYRDMLFGGYRFRSEIRAHQRVARYLGKRLITLELAHPHFYHLDTCFSPLDDRSALYYPAAFDRKGRNAIESVVQNPIAVNKHDAEAFACNALAVGRSVVLNKAGAALKARLKKEGFNVVETPTSEFMKAGGSVKCLVLKL
jgi:N-dimethylarginine dimethylaminohydrolase